MRCGVRSDVRWQVSSCQPSAFSNQPEETGDRCGADVETVFLILLKILFCCSLLDGC